MIYFFTVAVSERSTTSWWARLFESERSYCFDRLTSLLEPEPTHPARFAWLDAAAEGLDFESAQRHAVLRGFPDYFQRLWQQSRAGPFHIGNCDPAVDRFLPGLWLLWPDMRFLFAWRNGIGEVDSEVPGGASNEEFGGACRAWFERATRLKTHQAWLVERGAEVRETRLELLAESADELEAIWTAFVGEWPDYRQVKLRLLAGLGAILEPAEAIWDRWSEERRRLFTNLCGPAHERSGYALPSAGGAFSARAR